MGGAAVRELGGDYYNPDEIARILKVKHSEFAQTEANSKAWLIGKKLLEKAIANRLDFAFESTLGANTIPVLLRDAAQTGYEIHVWYAGLSNPELHLERVRSRVRKGGHDIPEADIRRRYEHSRLNLINLLPHLAVLYVYDNSVDADPATGAAPEPALVLHMERGEDTQCGRPSEYARMGQAYRRGGGEAERGVNRGKPLPLNFKLAP